MAEWRGRCGCFLWRQAVEFTPRSTNLQEKIKTIGDAYVAVGGLRPDPRRNHVNDVVNMGISVQVRKRCTPSLIGLDLPAAPAATCSE